MDLIFKAVFTSAQNSCRIFPEKIFEDYSFNQILDVELL